MDRLRHGQRARPVRRGDGGRRTDSPPPATPQQARIFYDRLLHVLIEQFQELDLVVSGFSGRGTQAVEHELMVGVWMPTQVSEQLLIPRAVEVEAIPVRDGLHLGRVDRVLVGCKMVHLHRQYVALRFGKVAGVECRATQARSHQKPRGHESCKTSDRDADRQASFSNNRSLAPKPRDAVAVPDVRQVVGSKGAGRSKSRLPSTELEGSVELVDFPGVELALVQVGAVRKLPTDDWRE